jgi:6-phosphogluconolactonase
MKTFATLSLTLLTALTMPAAPQTIFLGTSTPKDGASRGIYAVQLDPATGALSEPVLAAEAANPGFLVLHPNGRVLYALGEITADGKSGGAVSAYALDPASGRLTLLNQQPSGGSSLTHLAVDATGRALVAVSYGGGYVVSFPLEADGRVEARTGSFPLTGPLGPNKLRQEKSHAHSVTISPDNRFAFVADLGLDRVFSYRLDAAKALLTPNDPAFITITPGAGPRHSKFSRDGRFFYVLNEIDGSITACAYDAARGAGTTIQHISTLPADFKVTDPDRAAEIRIHPNGKFVYASNRGHDSIAVFSVNADGTLKLVGFTPSGGAHPRNFALSPDGAWLVCANRDSNNLVVFKVDPATGKLTATGRPITVPQAICVLFAPTGK